MTEVNTEQLIDLVKNLQLLEEHISKNGNGCGIVVNSAISSLSHDATRLARIDSREKALQHGLVHYFEGKDRMMTHPRHTEKEVG